jgi:hypothetical protein
MIFNVNDRVILKCNNEVGTIVKMEDYQLLPSIIYVKWDSIEDTYPHTERELSYVSQLPEELFKL